VKELEKYKWEAPDFLNGNKKKVTVSDGFQCTFSKKAKR